MFDKELVEDILQEMLEATKKVRKRCRFASSADDFLKNEESQILLDSICMQLIAIGEAVKRVDKITQSELFKKYPKIEWRSIAGMRDILSHHYFDLNAESVYGVCEEEIEKLQVELERIIDEL